DLALEAALAARARGALLRGEREAVDVGARDAAVLRDALGRLELARALVPGIALGQEVARPVDDVGAGADVAHHLDPAADPDVGLARAPRRGARVVRRLPRPALRVDRRAARVPAGAAREPGVARDVARLLPGLRDAAADHLLDLLRVDAGALDHRLLHARE